MGHVDWVHDEQGQQNEAWMAIYSTEWEELLVHSRNVNNAPRILAAHNALASRNQSKWMHTNCGPNRLRQDEQCVQDLIACMFEFDSFPFNPTSPTLCTLQSAMPASSQLVADFNSAHAAKEMKLEGFLKERVYSMTTSLHARVPLSKRLTFFKEPCTEKNKGESWGQNSWDGAINKFSRQLLTWSTDWFAWVARASCCGRICGLIQLQWHIQKSKLQPIDLQEPYIALVDMGMIWRMATLTAEDCQAQDGTPYKWSDYVQKVSSIIFARNNNATCIMYSPNHVTLMTQPIPLKMMSETYNTSTG